MKISERVSDSGVQLGVLEQLLRSGALDGARLAGALETAARTVRAESSWWADGKLSLARGGGLRVLRHGVAALGDVEVTDGELASVTALDFDGGNEIYMWLDANWRSRWG